MNKQKIKEELLRWISQSCPPDATEWLKKSKYQVENAQSIQPLFSSFTMAFRRMGKSPLNLDEEQQQKAKELRANWVPANLILEQASRILLLLSYPSEDAEEYVKVVKKLLKGADMNEEKAIYAALPLFPHPEHFLNMAFEGTRSNITEIFDTITLDNPYPYEYFPDEEFNRLVLKAAFMGRPFMKIVGIEERSNPALASLLLDLISERWAAGRSTNPLLWRLIMPALEENVHEGILAKAEKQDKLSRLAVELALQESSIQKRTGTTGLDWEKIEQEWEKSQTT